MELSTVQEVLLSILALALAVLLLLAIAIAIMVIRLLRVLRNIASDASQVVESAEVVGEVLARATGPLSLLHFLQVIIESVTRHQRKNKRR